MTEPDPNTWSSDEQLRLRHRFYEASILYHRVLLVYTTGYVADHPAGEVAQLFHECTSQSTIFAVALWALHRYLISLSPKT